MLAKMGTAVSQVVVAPLLFASEQSFWDKHGGEVTALITVVVTILIALVVDRFVLARATTMATRVGDTGVSRTVNTRLRVVRRLVFATILIFGFALALSQFGSIKKVATAILASSAVLGLILGFAARQTLGNMIAGIWLAVTQPIRIGDRISFEDVTGRVDDVTLSYTYIDPGDGDLAVIPNESIVSGTVLNHSTGHRGAPVVVSCWVPAATDMARAREALKDSAGAASVSVAEWTEEGIRLEVSVTGGVEGTRAGDEEAVLRERAQSALRGAGLLDA
jgi:small-conductance mechanosensitive channel